MIYKLLFITTLKSITDLYDKLLLLPITIAHNSIIHTDKNNFENCI